MDSELTAEDIDILIDSIDAWMHKENTSNLMVMMLDAAFIPPEKRNNPEYMEKRNQEREQQMIKQSKDIKIKSERGVLLKAKLIQLRDKIQITEVIK